MNAPVNPKKLIKGALGDWEVVIGMEIHAQVTSRSKLFSGAPTAFGAEPNDNVSLVDAAMPGMLPVINRECVAQAVRTGLGLKAQINHRSVFDRKNYFYPDLPQGYQISQYKSPIVGEGEVLVDLPDGASITVGIERLHLEQDAGKSLHDQDPLRIVAGFLTDRKLASRPVAIEETLRYFAVDALQRTLPGIRLVSANPVVRGCRMVKTPAEIALMQMATDVTIAAYRWTQPRVERGMTGAEIGALMNAATRALGGAPEFALALIGPAAALPHGSREVHRVADGQVVLMDCGCTVQGYQSDVSRTWVHGAATIEQRRVWDQVARGQQVALAAARIGVAAGSVDDAVRRYYGSLGYGPDYRLPGLSHRTGHGIGMDGHEPVNLVRGETTKLAAGMCFSNEPGLYLPGRFGVRLEDCFHMTPAGPRWFSEPPRSIDAPV